ncbi:MAG: hypothetical protein L3J21_09505 [Devosiaceae bacterium]|nr:hypothetical protein [Devosiaceae bacterium]
MNSSIGFGVEGNLGPLVGGVTYLGGSSVTVVPADVMYSFGLLGGAWFGNNLVEIDENTVAARRADGSFTVTSYDEGIFFHGGAQLSLGLGFSGIVTLFDGTPTEYANRV